VPDGRATSKQVRDGSQSAIPTASVQETSTGCPKRRNTLTERVPIRPTQDMGRIATGGNRRRWHIVDDWLGAPICGRVPESAIVDGRLYDDVRGERICQHCHHELSWRPSPAEYVQEDRGYETPCLIWRRALDADGYGKRGRSGKWTFAHRDTYAAEYGEIPAGYIVHHKCGQADCLRLDHLEAMSRADHVRLHRAGKPFVGGRRV
jgi:hypothetical protein